MMQRHMPIGYKMKDGKIYEDTEKASLVRQIFIEYLSGISTYQISKNLTNQGVPNANSKPSWNHGSIGNILENTRYLGDELYPSLIDPEIFKQVQARRLEQCHSLGRQVQPNSRKNQSVFSGRLRCGECGERFRKYVEHCGKPSERSNWKCKKYIYRNRTNCCCKGVTDEQLIRVFLASANTLLQNPGMLDVKRRETPRRLSPQYRRLDEEIRMLEAEKQTGQELSGLIFQRAEAAYQTAEVNDFDFNTERIKNEFTKFTAIDEFNEQLFLATVREMIIYKNGQIVTEFINGTTIEQTY